MGVCVFICQSSNTEKLSCLSYSFSSCSLNPVLRLCCHSNQRACSQKKRLGTSLRSGHQSTERTQTHQNKQNNPSSSHLPASSCDFPWVLHLLTNHILHHISPASAPPFPPPSLRALSLSICVSLWGVPPPAVTWWWVNWVTLITFQPRISLYVHQVWRRKNSGLVTARQPQSPRSPALSVPSRFVTELESGRNIQTWS